MLWNANSQFTGAETPLWGGDQRSKHKVSSLFIYPPKAERLRQARIAKPEQGDIFILEAGNE